MKKLTYIILPAILILSGCKKDLEPVKYELYDDSAYTAKVDAEGFTLIDFYGLNDFHGSIERSVDDNMPGLAAINGFLKDKRSENPGGTVLIANGDMWQGSADSNMTKGKIVNESMNYMGFAALTLGNHEFDWSVEQIKTNKSEYNLPYLGTNIVEEISGENPDFIDESPLIERDGVKIGIIGAMGSELINTIQRSYVEGLKFDIMTDYVTNEAARLREAGAHIIFLAAHDSWVGASLTPDRALLVDNGIVDAVFTGHQHYLDEKIVSGVPILQTRGRGRDIMHTRLGYNKTTNEVKVMEYQVIRDLVNIDITEDQTTRDIVDYFVWKYKINETKNEVLGKVINENMTRSMVANFVVEVMTKSYEEAVGALHNVNGGIRAEFNKGNITYGNVYNAFPFDNEIYVVSLFGSRLRGLMEAGGNFAYYFKLKYEEVDTSKLYKVVTTNFVYELSGSPVVGATYENMFSYPRDLVADYIRTNKTIDGSKY
ncbi:MAG: 5'-nucleotidase C-terminal domain-containing protein [Bacilli bacterium]|nr:5'-nucleotidase C-terminal domain-containing protein [Bacilli bacterium]